MSQSQSMSKYRTTERLLRDQDILAVRTLQYFLEIIYDTGADSFLLRSILCQRTKTHSVEIKFRGQDNFLEISPYQRTGLLSRSHDMLEDRTPSERARSLSKDFA